MNKKVWSALLKPRRLEILAKSTEPTTKLILLKLWIHWQGRNTIAVKLAEVLLKLKLFYQLLYFFKMLFPISFEEIILI